MPDHILFDNPKDPKLPMSRRQVDQAREICHECPVRRDCLAFALVMDDAWGVWGGLTPAERQRALLLAGHRNGKDLKLDHLDKVAKVIELYDRGTLEDSVIIRWSAGAR